MANKSIKLSSVATVSAADNFADWLREKMTERRVSCVQLAQAIGYERKAILSYLSGKSSPKLDTLAAIFSYFGENRISIEINPRREADDKNV